MSHAALHYPQTTAELTLKGVLNSTPEDQSLVMLRDGAWTAHRPRGESVALSVFRSSHTVPVINGLPNGDSAYNAYRSQSYSANDGVRYTFFRQTGATFDADYISLGEADSFAPLYKRSSYLGNGIFSNSITIKTPGTWLLTASLAFGHLTGNSSYFHIYELYSSTQGALNTPRFRTPVTSASRAPLFTALFDTVAPNEIITLRLLTSSNTFLYASTRSSILGENITLTKIG